MKLLAGRHAISSIRFKVSGTILVLGLSLGICSELMCPMHDEGAYQWWCSFAWLATVSSMCTFSLAPLPCDRLFTRLVLAACCCVVAADGYFDFLDIKAALLENRGCTIEAEGEDMGNEYCWLKVVSDSSYCALDIAFIMHAACIGSCSMAALSTERMQVKMRQSVALYFVVMTVVDLLIVPLSYSMIGDVDEFWLYVPPGVLGYFVVTRPKVRTFVQRNIRRLFEARGTTAAAAGLASLVGDIEIGDVISQAKLRFKGIDVEKLCLEDLRLSAASRSLCPLSCQVRLGCCDAFVSHSWHDHAETKWRAMQSWRASFHIVTNLEPVIWFDKACIDQSNIEDDLRFLPVFVSGCKELLILCGPSYCVFTYYPNF
eukprot:TRINITY_DN7926_c0_g1_i1.p1 TRINITY_DN7926_c0_g1~~TRINITY_DN7926_c0_g1_i1.p1  ORF type:complete len:373 (+),score=39.93 TRINITY_DN7926_c0_g1_i1:1273-2391(+)